MRRPTKEAKQNSVDDTERALKRTLHLEHCKVAWDAIQSSSDEYDKSILTLSSAMLGLSLTFMKDIVPIAQITHRYSLYVSWICFAVSVLSVICSFRLSIPAHCAHLKCLDDYYLRDDEAALSRKSGWSLIVECFNWASGLFFVRGLASSAYFVFANLWGKTK
jgi:hypothetical protein